MNLKNLSLEAKTRILILTTAGGIVSAVLIYTIVLTGIKENLDTLYEKRTLSLVSLQEIKELLSVNIFSTCKSVSSGLTEKKRAKEVLLIAKDMMEIRWTNYKNIKQNQKKSLITTFMEKSLTMFFVYESPDSILLDEDEIVKKLDERFVKISAFLDCDTRTPKDDVTLDYIIDNTNIYLGQLINFHLKKAIYEKDRSEAIYAAMFWMILAVTGMVFLFSIVIEKYILENMSSLHKNLEKMVEKKTKELKELNESLERRVAHEVKESRKKDDILYTQARLASMGEMIANIAHQWRQPLSALTMIIQSFRVKQEAGRLSEQFVSSQVDDGLTIAKQMSDTIEEFRNFFKPNKTMELFSLKKSILDSTSLLKGVFFQHNMEVELFCKKDVLISGYPNQFSQVIINILNNAKEAILLNKESEGKIFIFINAYTQLNKRFANVLIIDNGGGVDESKMERIFEPYFTTKHQTIGTGIGLYMSKRIIEEQFLGQIKVKNKMYNFKRDKLCKCALFSIKIPIG